MVTWAVYMTRRSILSRDALCCLTRSGEFQVRANRLGLPVPEVSEFIASKRVQPQAYVFLARARGRYDFSLTYRVDRIRAEC